MTDAQREGLVRLSGADGRAPLLLPDAAAAVAAALARIAALEAKVEILSAAIRKVEWSQELLFDGGRCCPCCDGMRLNGHDPDCALAAALKS